MNRVLKSIVLFAVVAGFGMSASTASARPRQVGEGGNATSQQPGYEGTQSQWDGNQTIRNHPVKPAKQKDSNRNATIKAKGRPASVKRA